MGSAMDPNGKTSAQVDLEKCYAWDLRIVRRHYRILRFLIDTLNFDEEIRILETCSLIMAGPQCVY